MQEEHSSVTVAVQAKIGALIREGIKNAGTTNKQLAGDIGVSTRNLSWYISGKIWPPAAALEVIERKLGFAAGALSSARSRGLSGDDLANFSLETLRRKSSPNSSDEDAESLALRLVDRIRSLQVELDRTREEKSFFERELQLRNSAEDLNSAPGGDNSQRWLAAAADSSPNTGRELRRMLDEQAETPEAPKHVDE